MLGLSISVVDVAVNFGNGSEFPLPPASFILLLDDDFTQSEESSLLNEDGSALIEEI
jgi:hypothetical protein